MKVYVDSSVLLRVVDGDPNRFPGWSKITQPISSELIRLECLRTVDRARICLGIDVEEVVERRATLLAEIHNFRLIPIDTKILERASQPLPTLMSSLDAIHLASALAARDLGLEFDFATHDTELALGAKAYGFNVHGVP